ncbi:MAG: RNA methyltransferase [Patescibacteria group bacterium]
MTQVNLEGRNVVLEALLRGRKIFEIFIDKNAKGGSIERIIKSAKEKVVKVTPVDRPFLQKISKTDSHQGIIALSEPIKTYSVSQIVKEVETPFIVVLKEVLYEHNLGAVLRSAAAAGVDAVVVSGSKDKVISPVVERVSMGASNAVKICIEGISSALTVIKRAGIKVVGVEASGSKFYFEEDMTGSLCLCFGGEDNSLALPQVKICDIVVRVPMENAIQSLNLSVAAGVVLFEKVRQDLCKK